MGDNDREIIVSFSGIECSESDLRTLREIYKFWMEKGYVGQRRGFTKIEEHIISIYANYNIDSECSIEFERIVSILCDMILGMPSQRMSRELFVRVGQYYDELEPMLYELIGLYLQEVSSVQEKPEFFCIEKSSEIKLFSKSEDIVSEVVINDGLCQINFEPVSRSVDQFWLHVDYCTGTGLMANDDYRTYCVIGNKKNSNELRQFGSLTVNLLFSIIFRFVFDCQYFDWRLCNRESYNLFCDWLRERNVSRMNRKRDVDLIVDKYVIDISRLVREDEKAMQSNMCFHRKFICSDCGIAARFFSFITDFEIAISRRTVDDGVVISTRTGGSFPKFCKYVMKEFGIKRWNALKTGIELYRLVEVYANFEPKLRSRLPRSVDFVCFNWLIGNRNGYLGDLGVLMRARRVIGTQYRPRAFKDVRVISEISGEFATHKEWLWS